MRAKRHNERRHNHFFTCYQIDADFTTWEELPPEVRYLVYQTEECPDSGRPHLQGYIELETSTRVRAVQRLLGGGKVHLEERTGTADQVIRYCQKAETRIEGPAACMGRPGGHQGSRSDLSAACDTMLLSGVLATAIKHPTTYVRYGRGLEKLRFARQCGSSSWRSLQVVLLWGLPGVGKTRASFHFTGPGTFKLDHDGGVVWFDGYDGELSIILDDLYGTLPYTFLLKVLDGHPLRLPVKGSFTCAAWKTVYITSNVPCVDWYPEVFHGNKTCAAYLALDRRITETIEVLSVPDDAYDCRGKTRCGLDLHLRPEGASFNCPTMEEHVE